MSSKFSKYIRSKAFVDFIENVPLVNLIYDIFVVTAEMNKDSVEKLCNILGLINALLLGAVLTLMTGVSYDDNVSIDQRFTSGGYESYWYKYYNQPPSVVMFNMVGNSLVMFFLGIIIIVYVYADGIPKMNAPVKRLYLQKLKKRVTELTNKMNVEFAEPDKFDVHLETYLFNAWWKVAKIGVFACFCTSFIGIVYASLACQVLFAMLYPDPYIEEHGDICYSCADCPNGYISLVFKTTLVLAISVTVLGSAYGTRRKIYIINSLNDIECLTDDSSPGSKLCLKIAAIDLDGDIPCENDTQSVTDPDDTNIKRTKLLNTFRIGTV